MGGSGGSKGKERSDVIIFLTKHIKLIKKI